LRESVEQQANEAIAVELYDPKSRRKKGRRCGEPVRWVEEKKKRSRRS
jgi:hypothetical protein